MLPSPQNITERASLLHRENLQLAVLIAVAAAAFLVTRAVAASNRNLRLHDAAEWYQRGLNDLAADRTQDAIDALRRATVRKPDDKQYMLALARALRRNGDAEGARGALLSLRESVPDDPEVNLQLARVAAQQQDVPEATRYYHNALYAPSAMEKPDERRAIRFELVRFLLQHGAASRALPDLMALSADVPDEARLHVQLGHLFEEAGDRRRALDQFQAALRQDATNGEALAAAGLEAFQLGEYLLARMYLRKASTDSPQVVDARAVVELILANDPLASRIGTAERVRRLTANFSFADERWDGCIGARTSLSEQELALQREIEAFKTDLKPPAVREQDTVEKGVDLLARIERHIVDSCPPAMPLDRALILIGREHGADER